MNAREHYREAEQCISRGHDDIETGDHTAALHYAEAQVHATLALVAATIDGIHARTTHQHEGEK